MNLNHDDKDRIHKALASYIEECRVLSEQSNEPDLTEHYETEAQEARELRARLKQS